jgi:DNA-directed RNA polymerase subunit M/transcription elongation factor TFIIS
MHFCNKCSNMYYIKLSDENENKLIYYCRNCGNESNNLTVDNMCVSKVQVQKNEQKYTRIINPYTKMDPTLPRINNIQCPNVHCESNGDEKTEPDILYIRYDDIKMKFVYLCTICDTSWKTTDQS